VLASPGVNRAVIHRDAGDLVVEAPDAAAGVAPSGPVRLGGTEVTAGTIDHAAIASGATLRFE
jgi:hypothetical protein